MLVTKQLNGQAKQLTQQKRACQFIHRKCRLLVWDVFIINSFYCITYDNDAVADIAHEVMCSTKCILMLFRIITTSKTH